MYEQLLQQARRLARSDPKKPKQSSLRRAISTAYYALFHFLVDQACRASIGAHHEQILYRQVLGRAFEHANMKNACASFAGGTLKTSVSKGLPANFSPPAEVRRLSKIFVDLQNVRHGADYDLTERFNRADVLFQIRQAEEAIREFKNLRTSNEKKFFLACLWAWKTLAKR